MKTLLSLSLALFALGVAGADDKDKKVDDQKKIQGKWELVRGEREGNAMDADFVKGFTLTFDGEKYEAKLADGSAEEGKFKLKSDDKPATATFTNNGGDERKAIYKWTGEELTLCVSDRGGEKPKDFAGKDSHMLLVLKKAK